MTPARAVIDSNQVETITVNGTDFIQPVQLTLNQLGSTVFQELAILSAGSSRLTAQIPADLTPGEYQIWVTNSNQADPTHPSATEATSATAGAFALFRQPPGVIKAEVGHWRFDKGAGATANDTSANGDHATTQRPNKGWIIDNVIVAGR